MNITPEGTLKCRARISQISDPLLADGFLGGPPQMPIHLTFDDGPGPSTGALMDVLARYGVRATFFIVGKDVDTDARTRLADAIRYGHEIGNHTHSHKLDQTENEFLGDVQRCDAVIAGLYEEAGQKQSRQPRIRLPYGIQFRNSRALYRGLFLAESIVLDPRLNLLASIGRSHFHWTNDTDDWRKDATAESILSRLVDHATKMERAHLNSVMLLHDSKEQVAPPAKTRTVAALEQFLPFARAQNWQFLAPTFEG